MERATEGQPTETRPLWSAIAYWVSVAALFVVVHATQDRLVHVIDSVASLTRLPALRNHADTALTYFASLKGMVFLLCSGVVALPILIDLRRLAAGVRLRQSLSLAAVSIGVAVLLAGLLFTLGNQSMGPGYAKWSVSPFSQNTGWFNQRLLMTAMAHVFFFRGGWLYYAFSNLIFLGFLALLWSWLREHAPLKLWQMWSLATCSFVVYQFQFPGYPDVLVFTLFLMAMTTGVGPSARLSCLLLALVAHESSLFMGVVLAFWYLNRNQFVSFLVAIAAYGAIWLAASGFDLPGLLHGNNVNGLSGVAWVLRAPGEELLGVFIAFKAVWAVVALGLITALRRHVPEDAAFIGAAIGAGVLMTVLGVDTSRLMGFAFPGILVAIRAVRTHMAPGAADRALSIIFTANLLIPSFYVGLNTGVVTRPGAYAYWSLSDRDALARGRPVTMRVRLTGAWMKVATLTLVVVGCLALAELGLRAFHPDPFMRPRTRMPNDTVNELLHRRSSIPGLDFELAPNVHKEAFGVMVDTNSYGMRGPEPLPAQTSSLYRIVAIGDSFTFGAGVPGADTYPSVLSRLLNSRQDLQHQFDVLNLGVAAYSTRDEALMLRYRGLQWNPRLVIVGYVLNDPEIDPLQPLQAYYQTPAWWQYLSLGRLLAHAKHGWDIGRLGHGDYTFYLHAEGQRKWASVLTAFQDIAQMTAPRDVKVLVVIFPEIPNHPTFSWAQYPYGPIHRQVAEAATRNGFQVLDLLESFSRYPPKDLILSFQDTHPNRRADELAAQAIFDKLIAQRAGLF